MPPDGQAAVQAPTAGERACHLVDHEGAKPTTFDRLTVERLLERNRFFWIDLYHPHADDFTLMRDVFKFHPLAVEDSEHFGQRPKLDDYDDYVLLVAYGAALDEDRLVEVHCFYSEKYLITVHRDDAPALAELRERYGKRRDPIQDPPLLLYKIVDGLVDSFFPILAEFDDRIDELENQIFLNANDADNGATAPESGHHNWVLANQRTAAALKAKSYHYRFVFGLSAGHCQGNVQSATPRKSAGALTTEMQPALWPLADLLARRGFMSSPTSAARAAPMPSRSCRRLP